MSARPLDLALIAVMAATAVSAQASPDNPVTKHAAEAGVRKCLPALRHVSDFLIEGESVGTYSVWNTKAPDKHVFSTVIERNYGDGTVLTNLTVAPVANGQCAAVYESISYFPKSCDEVSKKVFPHLQYKRPVKRDAMILEDATGLNVFLLPLEGDACLSVKKEVLMEATPSR